jgi:hypothetical protein
MFIRLDTGSLLQAVGPAHENARSPSLVRVREATYVDASMLADLRPDRACIEDDRLTISLRYDGQLPTFNKCISRHNLHCILQVIGNQCESFSTSEMWSVRPHNFKLPVESTLNENNFITRMLYRDNCYH